MLMCESCHRAPAIWRVRFDHPGTVKCDDAFAICDDCLLMTGDVWSLDFIESDAPTVDLEEPPIEAVGRWRGPAWLRRRVGRKSRRTK